MRDFVTEETGDSESVKIVDVDCVEHFLYPADHEDGGYAEAANIGANMTIRHVMSNELKRVIGYWAKAFDVNTENRDIHDPFWCLLAQALMEVGGRALQIQLLDQLNEIGQAHWAGKQLANELTPSPKLTVEEIDNWLRGKV